MASRSIRINLSADATNFSENIRRASRSLNSLGSDLNGNLNRIKLHTSLLISTLGNAADGMQKMGIQSDGLAKRIDQQSKYTRRLEADLAKMNPTTAAAGVEFLKLETRILDSAVKSQTLINRLDALKVAMANLRPTEALTLLSRQLENSAISTQRLVANLGAGASAFDKNRASVQGLNRELDLTIKKRAALRTAISSNAKSQPDGLNSEAVKKLTNELNAIGLKEQQIRNQISELNKEFRTLGANEGVAKLASAMQRASISSKILVEGLGAGASAGAKNEAVMKGLNRQLVLSEQNEKALRSAIAATASAYGRNSAEIRALKTQLDSARLSTLQFKNQMANLKIEMANLKPSQELTKMASAMENARIASQRYALELSAGATAADKEAAALRGLNGELVAAQNNYKALQNAAATSARTRGVNAPETIALNTQSNAAQVAMLGIVSSIGGLRNQIADRRTSERMGALRSGVDSASGGGRLAVARLGLDPSKIDLYSTQLKHAKTEVAALTAQQNALRQAASVASRTFGGSSQELADVRKAYRDTSIALEELINKTKLYGQELKVAKASASYDVIAGEVSRGRNTVEEQMTVIDSARTPSQRADVASMTARRDALRRLREQETDLTRAETELQHVVAVTNRQFDANSDRALAMQNRHHALRMELLRVRTQISEMTDSLRLYNRVASALSNPSVMGAGIGMTTAVTYPLGRLLGEGIKYNAMMEMQTTAFTTMLGSAREAKQMMADLQAMAVVTPFETQDLTTQATTLKQYGVAAKNILPMLNLMGDLSLGNKDKFQIIAYNFAQAASLGRLQAIDARSMTLAGFNPIAAISARRQRMGSKDFGIDTIQDQMEDGQISIKELVQAMQEAAAKGGIFYKAMEAASKTYEGRLSTLRDKTKIAFGAWTYPLTEWMTNTLFPALIRLTDWMGRFAMTNPNFTKWAIGITMVVGAIGPLLLAVYGIGKAMGAISVGWDYLKLALSGMRGAFTSTTASAGLLIAKLVLVGTAIYILYKTTSSMENFGKKLGALMFDQFTLDVNLATRGIYAFLLAKQMLQELPKAVASGDLIEYWKNGSAGINYYKNKLIELEKEAEPLRKNMAESWGDLKGAGKEWATEAGKEFANAWNNLPSLFNFDSEFIGPIYKPELDVDAFFNSTKSEADKKAKAAFEKLVDELKALVGKVRTQAEKFRDALGFFDKAIIEKLSPEKLMIRIKNQMKIFGQWTASLADLKIRLGSESPLFQATLAAGPNSPVYSGLSKMSDLELGQTNALYNQIGDRAAVPAGLLVKLQAKQDIRDTKLATQLTVNINGGVVVGNESQLVDVITKEFRRQGF